jgi:Membrane protein involved in the export of O-antigen and teichoic acid
MSSNQDLKKSFKATSLFGGVQVFTILISIVRSKLVALLIGPVGIGMVELYTSTLKLIGSSTDFSLGVCAVRDVSVAYKSGDKERFKHVISIFSRVLWITGLLGTVICLFGSPLWSKLTFGNYDFTLGFVLLSVVLLLDQLKNGKNLLLQSTEHFSYIAYSGIIGNVLGLITTVPIYYFFGVDGIVAVLIFSSLFPYLLAHFFTSKLIFKYEKVGFKSVVKEGGDMLRQGFFLSVNFLFSTLIFYVLRIFISNRGGIAELGLYSSGFAIVNTYIGMVIQSMSQEYYPRISALSVKQKEFNEAVDKQAYFSLLLLGPMIICFLAFSEQFLIILYSEKFVGATMFMALSMLGVVFQAPSWCMGYAFLAKGDNKVFLIFETISKVLKLIVDISFYLLWGLAGIGLSFIVSYIYYTIQCCIVCHRRYGLKLSRSTLLLQLMYFILGIIVLMSTRNLPLLLKLAIGGAAIIASVLYSYTKLDKMMDVSGFIKRKFKHQ